MKNGYNLLEIQKTGPENFLKKYIKNRQQFPKDLTKIEKKKKKISVETFYNSIKNNIKVQTNW